MTKLDCSPKNRLIQIAQPLRLNSLFSLVSHDFCKKKMVSSSRSSFSELMGLKRTIKIHATKPLNRILHQVSQKFGTRQKCTTKFQRGTSSKLQICFSNCALIYMENLNDIHDFFCPKFLGPFLLLLQEEATKKSPHSLKRNELHLQTSLQMEKRPQMTWFDAMGLDMVQILI